MWAVVEVRDGGTVLVVHGPFNERSMAEEWLSKRGCELITDSRLPYDKDAFVGPDCETSYFVKPLSEVLK